MTCLKGFMLCAAMLLGIIGLQAQTPDWLWEDSFGAYPGSDRGQGIIVDSLGNCFVSGSYGSTLYLSSPQTGFVAKYNIYGNRQWVNTLGQVGNDDYVVSDIVSDSEGFLYITGKTGGYNFGSTFINGFFIAKMDNNGSWIWARQIITGATPGSANIAQLAYDSAGYLYIIGSFIDYATFGTITLNSSNFAGFVAKISTSGTWTQAFVLYGLTPGEGSIAVDSSSNLYITGAFRETMSIGSTNLTSNGERDIFVTKRSASGTWLWAKSAGSSSHDIAYDIAVDNYENVYLTGSISNSAVFGDITPISGGAFISKLDSAGNWMWVNVGGTSGFGVEIDNEGSIRLACNFNGTITLGTITLTGSESIFIAKLDSSGNWFWAIVHDNFHGYDLTLDIEGNSYVTGSTYGNVNVIVAKLGYEVPPTILLTTNNRLNFGSVYVEESSLQQAITIINTGTEPLTISDTYLATPQGNFQLVTPSLPFDLGSGVAQDLYVSFTPQYAGAINDSLIIINNSFNDQSLIVSLIGTGLHVLPKLPQNLSITLNASNAQLNWDPVTENMHDQTIVPDYYFIYNANKPEGEFVLNGLTPNTSYIHPYIALGANRMFYRVTAVKFYREDISPAELDSYLKKNITTGMRESDVQTFLNEFK